MDEVVKIFLKNLKKYLTNDNRYVIMLMLKAAKQKNKI